MSDNTQGANRQIARAAGVVMAGFVLSNLIGLFRQILVSNAFGTQSDLDAFLAAIRFPDTLFSLIAGGALASAFVPTFTGMLETENRHRAWQMGSAILNLVFITLSVVSVIAWIFASQVVRFILAPFFPPELQSLTTSLLRVLLISPAIFGVSGLLMGMLNAHQHFLLPALAPSLHWVGWILGIWLFVPRWGIHGLAWGAVLGAVMHLGVQVPGLVKLKGRYFPTLGLRLAEVREVGRLMAPRLVGVAAVQLNFVVNTIIASGQPEGSVTAIDNAWRIMLMPQVIIAQAVAIAALPTFSAQAARGRFDEMRSSLASTLRGVLLLAIPASLGLMLLREPIIAIILERGAFDAHSTQLVSWALLWFASGLVGHSVVEIVSRSFYALHDTKTPVIIGVGAMTLNVFLSLGFSALFRSIGWAPHGGLALSNSLATTLEMILLMILMSRRLNGLDGRRILSGALAAAAGTIVMSLSILAWQFWTEDRGVLLSGGGAVLVGTVIYGLIILSLRVPEVKSVLSAMRRKT